MAAMHKRRRQSRLKDDRGFTLVELLITATLIAVGIMANVATFDYTRRTTHNGEKLAVMSHQAQAESERIQSLAYTSVGHTGAPPTGSGASTDPATYVNSAATPPTYAYDWTSTGQTEQLVTTSNGCTGCAVPYSTAWSDGRYSGTLYRFITWVDDTCAACTPTRDYKRITVVVTLSGRKPFLTSTVMRNPE
jgi:prepilin-type N-terminal cleavage/methylation domain-containing protein